MAVKIHKIEDKRLDGKARKPYQMTPAPRQVRLCGVLDMIRASTQTFSLKLDSGEMVWGTCQTSDFSEMGSLFKQRVLVLGKASFRPSGHILRVDAVEILPATESDSFFSRLPIQPLKSSKGSSVIPKSALKGKDGIAAVFGKWPGDESDADFEEILREIS